MPSELSVKQNAEVLAWYALIYQENGLIPIGESEILTDVYKSLNDRKVLLRAPSSSPTWARQHQELRGDEARR